jgi:myo-inositol-1(or 4)-monophosphatase
MPSFSGERLAMVRAAELAGQGLLRDFARVGNLPISEKGPGDFVSSADIDAQEIIYRDLSAGFPGYGFLFEESQNASVLADARFIVDPLDGTTNFLRGIAYFAVSIGLEVKGEIVAGVVFNPALAELFWAEKSKGAWLGDKRLSVSAPGPLGRCVVGTGIPHAGRPAHERFLTAMARIMPEVAGVRRLGSAALDIAHVAAGRFDMFWEWGLAPWDVAAAQLLVHEAGGIVTKCDGKPMQLDDGDILAVNHPSLQSVAMKWLSPST